jgi:tetratricopeptide (TPR) repeat protein
MTPLREPLDEVMARYWACTEPGSRVLELLSIVDILLRSDGLRLCASLLHDEDQQEESISRALLEGPLGVGGWLSVVERLVKLPERQGSDYRRWFDAHRSARHFERLKAFRDAYAHCRGSREPAVLAGKLRDIEQTLTSCLGDRPALGPFSMSDGELFWRDGARDVACAPLLLPGELVGADGSVLSFSRCDDEQPTLHYLLAVAGECQVPNAEQRYEQLVALVRRKSQLTAETLGKRALREAGSAAVLSRRFREYAVRGVQRSVAHQPAHPLVERLEADTRLRGFLGRSARVLVVVGPEGAGVSCWLRQVVERRLQAGEAVVFDTASELPEATFPEFLAGGLGCGDGLGRVVYQAARESPDGQLLVVLDDLSLGSGRNGLLHHCKHWSDRQRSGEVRFVLGLRSSEHAAALKRWPEGTGDEGVALLNFPRFSAHEVRLLAETLPGSGDAELEARRKLVAHLLHGDEDAARRPRFLVNVLREAQASAAQRLELSPVMLRERQFEAACQTKGRTLRGPLALQLARVLLERHKLRVPLLDPALLEGRLFFEQGTSTRTYEELLASGLLVEDNEPDGPLVGFASTAMFALVAARGIELAELWPRIMALVTVSEDFESALEVAAHAVVRWARLPSQQRTELMADSRPEVVGRLLRAVAALDRKAFLTLLQQILQGPELDWLLPVLVATKESGQARTASLGLSLLGGARSASPDLAQRARIANGYALWDLDEYAAVELELRDVHVPRAQLLLAMIATARGEFEIAKALYDELSASAELDPELASEIPMRSAPALIALGEGARAERQLRACLAALPPDAQQARAEILGHLGEALAELGRLSEAEAHYEDSMALNRQLGSLVGQGVCHAVLGDLRCRQQRYDEARVELDLSLDIARRVDNPWREAWTLLRMARVAAACGETDGAATLAESGRSLFARIGCRTQ